MAFVIQRISDGNYISGFEEGDGYRQFIFTKSIVSALQVGEEIAHRICDLDFCTGKPLVHSKKYNPHRNNIEYKRVLVSSPT